MFRIIITIFQIDYNPMTIIEQIDEIKKFLGRCKN